MERTSSGMETLHPPEAATAQSAWPIATNGPSASLGPVVALTVALGVAAFVAVLAVALLLVAPQVVPGLAPLKQRQDAESALYLVAFALILPAAVIAVPRVADAIAAGPNAGGLSFLAALLVATLAVAVIVARVLPGSDAADALGAVVVWWAGAVALLARAWQRRPFTPLLRLADRAPVMWGVAGALGLASPLVFASLGSISIAPLVLGAGAVALAVWLASRRAVLLPRLPRGWGYAVDAAIVAALALTIPNLVIFVPGGSPGHPLLGFEASVIQFHQDFLLGPANQVLAGDPVLVHTASQYGVAPIYLLAGFFQVAPIGYGTLGFLDGILYVLLFTAGYVVLRLAGTPRLLAAGALGLAVIVLLYNLLYPVGGLLQHGPLRFGLPMLVIVAAAVRARWPRLARAARATALVVVGLSAIWALETFAYTVVTFAAIVGFEAWSRPGPGRLGWLARQAALAVAACVAAHLLFAGATLASAGRLPDWGQYLDYLKALLHGRLADITYDFSSWSPGLPVGVAYAASAIGFVLLVARRREVVERERVALTVLAGTTAYGIALYTYFVNRSADDILPYVSFPAIVAGTLWLSLLLRGALAAPRRARLGGLVFALMVAMLLLSIAWSSIGDRFDQSPLAYALPGGKSLGAAMNRLWHPPPIDRRAPAGQRLLDRYLPDERRVPILVSADLGIEILMRSGRANTLPFDDPVEDFFVKSPHVAAMRRAVARLRPGDRVLMQNSGLAVLAAIKRQPARDLLNHPLQGQGGAGERLTPQQEWILGRISERFDVRNIHRDEQGFVVVELARRA